MKINKYIYLFGILLIVTFFTLSAERLESLGRVQPQPGSKPPVITHSFAVEKAYYGYVWKFYIEAEDPDSDMYKILAIAHQPGYGTYTNILPIVLKPGFRQHLKGYIQWNSFSSKASYIQEWTQVTLRISIVDKGGYESNEVIFPITFESGVKSQYTLPAPFDQGEVSKLGYLDLDLVDPYYSNSNDRHRF
jgi:hypothetical protein